MTEQEILLHKFQNHRRFFLKKSVQVFVHGEHNTKA